MQKPDRAALYLSFLLPAFLAVLLPALDAQAGPLKGKFKTTKDFSDFFQKSMEATAEDKGDYYWLVENAVLPIQPPAVDWARELVVAIMKKGNPPGFDKIQNVIISGATFSPSTIIVPPKTTIKFKNEDPFVHSLYSLDLGTSFTPEILPSRQLRQIQFLNPGTYLVRCKMTPHLEGYVIVDPDVVDMIIPAADGTFTYENLAPGKYQLKLYYKGQLVGVKGIEILDEKAVEVEVEIVSPAKLQDSGKEGGAAESKSGEGKEGGQEGGEGQPAKDGKKKKGKGKK